MLVILQLLYLTLLKVSLQIIFKKMFERLYENSINVYRTNKLNKLLMTLITIENHEKTLKTVKNYSQYGFVLNAISFSSC